MKRVKAVTERERYRILRAMLEDRRSEIHDKLRSLRESLPAEAAEVRDIEEQSVDDLLQEVDFALMEMKSETLRQIDEAIRRLEAGSYGHCVECSREMTAARLKALPFARLCRDCQEQKEERCAAEREQRTTDGQFARVVS